MKFSLQKDLAPFKFETYGELLDMGLSIERAQKQLEEYRNKDNKKRTFQNFNSQPQNRQNNFQGNNSQPQNRQNNFQGNNNHHNNRNNHNGNNHHPNNNNNNNFNNKRRWNGQNNGQRTRNPCPLCGNQHDVKMCPRVTGACYNCGEKGHFTARCPKKTGRPNQGQGGGQPPRVQGRIYAMTQGEAETSNSVVRGNSNVAN